LSLLVIFDLDDTLYPEIEFVSSGFRAVAEALAPETGIPVNVFYRQLLQLSDESRLEVFDRFINNHHLEPDFYLPKMICLYREHYPEINLFADVMPLLNVLRSREVKVGIISDGYYQVQTNKVKALKLTGAMDKIVLTDFWGRAYWKPHPRAFTEMLGTFKIEPARSFYIGDNPLKDFLAPNKLRMRSVRILRENGLYLKAKAPAGGEATYTIDSLAGLPAVMDKITL